ncbi:MAG: hypothetical protein WD492_14925 [Alkalispirochaeta sp.]
MTNSLWWPIILSSCLVVAGLLLLMLPWGPMTGGHELRPWQNFDALVIPNIDDEQRAVQRLQEAGEEVLYIGNASVAIEDFDGGTEVAVADLAQRLDPDDPRFDPFSAALGSLFRTETPAGPAALLYLERRGSMVSRWTELERYLSGVEFYLLGWQPLLPAVSGAVVFLSLLPATFGIRRRRGSAVTVQLVVTAYTVVGGPHTVIPAVLAGLSWVYWHGQSYDLEREWLVHGRSVRLEPDHAPAILFLLSAMVALVATAPTTTSGGGAVAALVGTWAVSVAVHRRNVRRSDHTLFSPRRILQGRVTLPGLLPALSLVVAGSAGLIALGAGLGGPSGGLTAPMPEHLPVGQPVSSRASGDPEDREDLERIVEGIRAISPVDEPLSTAGYLAHRWYQETLMYGGRYEVPKTNEAVELQRLRRDEGRLEAYQSEVERFDEEWIARQFSSPPGTAYRLFIRERGAFRITFQPLRFAVVDINTYGRRALLLLIPFITLALSIRLPYRGVLGTVGAVSRSARQ